jgi:hypothetical protein
MQTRPKGSGMTLLTLKVQSLLPQLQADSYIGHDSDNCHLLYPEPCLRQRPLHILQDSC